MNLVVVVATVLTIRRIHKGCGLYKSYKYCVENITVPQNHEPRFGDI